jgi:hypothetical protein
MPGFFDALEKFTPSRTSTTTVNKNGQSIVVSKEKYREILAKGIDNFELVDGELLFQEKKVHRHSILLSAEKGMSFLDGNVFWPDGVKEQGHVWKKD